MKGIHRPSVDPHPPKGSVMRKSISFHYGDVIMGAMASRITGLTIVCKTVHSGADQRQRQSSASLPFVRGIQRGSANSPHKRPVTRKMSPSDDVIMPQRLHNASTSTTTSSHMMTKQYKHAFRVTGHLCRKKSIADHCIPVTSV